MLFIQETRFTSLDRLTSATYFLHRHDSRAQAFWSHSSFPTFTGHNGVGIIFGSNHPFTDIADLTSSLRLSPILHNRYMILSARLGTQLYHLHCVYAPSQPRDRAPFFSALPTQFSGDTVHMVCGDFNLPLDPLLDQADPKDHRLSPGRLELLNWLQCLSLIDPWRISHPDTRLFSGPGQRHRLDYCFLSLTLFDSHLQDIHYIPPASYHHEDHHSISFRLTSRSYPLPSRTPWRCPVWLLRDRDVINHLFTSLTLLSSSLRRDGNPGCLLDEHKRRDSIYLRQTFASKRAFNERRLDHLRAHYLELQATSPPSSPSYLSARAEYHTFRKALEDRRQSKRFCMDLYQTERSTSTFFRPPTPPALRLAITSVNLPDGTLSSCPQVIATQHRNYWARIYRSPTSDLASTLSDSNFTYSSSQHSPFLASTTSRLNPQQRSFLDAPFTARDFYDAIVHTAKGKTAGPDGLPAEYYQLFPTLWGPVMELVYSSQLRLGRMTKFQRRSYLSLLSKPGDRADPSNYRPLMILNQDAKFGPKILAYRLNSVLSSLLHPDQHGFVPGRGVREALRRFLDLQHLCKRLPSLKYAGAIFLDFAKAFDSVDHSALHSTLSHFGFGPNFSQWIRTFYRDNITTTLINGSPGSFFQLGSGVRQGDPLSPGLFVVYIEPLLSFLRSTLHQHGIITPIHTSCHLTLAFADDITGILADLRHAPTFIAHVNSFCSAVGMELNLTKTVVLPFTGWDITHPTRSILQQHHLRTLDPTDFTRLLGVLVGGPTSTPHQLALLLHTIHQRMVLWRWRARTYRGRVLLLKTIILPLLWHVGTAHYIPETFLAKLSILVRSFINKNITGVHSDRSPPGLLPLTWHAIPRSQGGLSLPSPVDTLRSYRLSVLISGLVAIRSTPLSAPHWFTPALCLFTLSLRHLGLGLDILYLPHIPSANMNSTRWVDLPPFWIDTLRTWTTLVRTSWDTNTRSPTQLIHQPLWNNGTILRGASRLPVFRTITSVQHLGLASIHRLSDLLSTTGMFPTSDTFKALLAPHLHRPGKAVTALLDTIRLLGLPPSLPAVFPTVPTYLLGAFDSWYFNSVNITRLTPTLIDHFLSTIRPPPLPYSPLGIIPDFSVSDTFWSSQDSYHRRVLPVIADLVYRLRHNALGCRYRYRWRTTNPQSTTCIFGCSTHETPRHLFWDCPTAAQLWAFYLPPLQRLYDTPITWTKVLFDDQVKLRPPALASYGSTLISEVFTCIRGCIFRVLWLHRNTTVYQPSTPHHSISLLFETKSLLLTHFREFPTMFGSRSPKAFQLRTLRLTRLSQHFHRYYRFHIFPSPTPDAP